MCFALQCTHILNKFTFVNLDHQLMPITEWSVVLNFTGRESSRWMVLPSMFVSNHTVSQLFYPSSGMKTVNMKKMLKMLKTLQY